MERPDRRAAQIVDRARQCVGIRFRLQGRGHEGMDCLGVVAAALSAVGCEIAAPAGYRLSGHDPRAVRKAIIAMGMREVAPALAIPGDVLMRFPGLSQVHFAVRTDVGLVEAHVAIGRVVERPWRDGEWATAWRLDDGGAR